MCYNKVINMLYQMPYYHVWWKSPSRFHFTMPSEIRYQFLQDASVRFACVYNNLCITILLVNYLEHQTQTQLRRSSRWYQMALTMISNGFIASENFGPTVGSYNVDRSERYPRRSRVSRVLHFAFDHTWNYEIPK